MPAKSKPKARKAASKAKTKTLEVRKDTAGKVKGGDIVRGGPLYGAEPM